MALKFVPRRRFFAWRWTTEWCSPLVVVFRFMMAMCGAFHPFILDFAVQIETSAPTDFFSLLLDE
jgi:hypothetical protein